MAKCAGCGIDFIPRSKRHRFHSPECRNQPPKLGPNRQALEDQVEAMATGREHRALVESCRGLADRVDYLAGLGAFDDKVWREYRLALKALREAVGDSGSDSFADLTSKLRRTEVPDSEDA